MKASIKAFFWPTLLAVTISVGRLPAQDSADRSTRQIERQLEELNSASEAAQARLAEAQARLEQHRSATEETRRAIAEAQTEALRESGREAEETRRAIDEARREHQHAADEAVKKARRAAAEVIQAAEARAAAGSVIERPTKAKRARYRVEKNIPDASVRRIESKVLHNQIRSATEALHDAEEAIAHATTPREAKLLETMVERYAAWLEDLQSQHAELAGESTEADESDESTIAGVVESSGVAWHGTVQELNEIAWSLLTAQDKEKRNALVGRKIAEAALSLSKQEGEDASPAILDTWARGLFSEGRHADAITAQKLALSKCEDDSSLKEELSATLAAYEKSELPEPETGGEPGPSQDELAIRLNSQAWDLVTSEETSERNPQVALALTEAALALAGPQEKVRAHTLDTRARALFLAGKRDEASATQKKAIEACGEGQEALKELLERTLESYEKGELPPVSDTPIGEEETPDE